MDSKCNIDKKISADATMNQGTPSGLNSTVTNVNTHLKDSKRVIKKMIVMDTSKLKGLGIESTIKNAMSKLERGQQKRTQQAIPKPTHAQPMHTSSQILQTVIKSEFDPKVEPNKPAETVIKQIYRPSVPPVPTTDYLTTAQVPVQPVPAAKASTQHRVVHLVRPSLPYTVSTSNIPNQSVQSMTPQVPVMKKVVQIASVPAANRMPPVTTASTIPFIKPQQNGQNDCSSKIVHSQTTNHPPIKTESNVPAAVANDGKKIQILSDVSLNDAKAKLLEIDKLSSKNLKLTNVIKGRDKSPSTSKVYPHNIPLSNAESKPLPVTVKIEIDRMPSFTNVIKVSPDSQSNSSPVFTSNSTRQPVFSHCVTSKSFTPGMTVSASKDLKSANIHEVKCTLKPRIQVANYTKLYVKPLNTSSISATVEDKRSFPKHVKFSNITEVPTKTIPPKILNFTNATEGIRQKSDFITQPVRSSYPTAKPPRTGIDTTSTKPVYHTNVSKSTVNFTTSQSATPLYIPSVPIKTEIDEPTYLNVPNHKGTVEFPLRTTVYKVLNPAASTCATSTASEVFKKLASTDENIEIVIPAKQKYLRRREGGLIERTPILDSTKHFQDAVWSTSNPRTYARHNIKRLLSDKIITKSRSQKESERSVQCKVANELISEVKIPVETDEEVVECVVQCDASSVEFDSKSENVESASLETEPLNNHSIPSTSASNPIDQLTGDAARPTNDPVQATDDPIQATIDPVRATDSPIEATNDPVQTTNDPVQATDDPIQATIDPVRATDSPIEATNDPVQTTNDPVQTTNDPVQTTNDPAQTTNDPVQTTSSVNAHSTTMLTNNFYGFSIEEVNASALVVSQIRAIVSERRSKIEIEKEIKTADCDNGNWVLNYETGVLEEQITKDDSVVLEQKDVPATTEADLNIVEKLDHPNAVFESTPKKQILSVVPVLKDSTMCDDSPIPSKIPVIEDADDEISDIDLAHHTKAKCTGNPLTPSVKNRRAILKSVELHRKAFMPPTTDDESELSLCVRPPRPKLRKSRQKQTVEQLTIQQNAHVSLLKRFTQATLDYDNLSDETLMPFIASMEDRMEMLENQVKCCFGPENRDDFQVQTESNVSTHTNPVDPVTEENEPMHPNVNPSESVAEINESVKPTNDLVKLKEISSSVNSTLKCVDDREEPQLQQNQPNDAENANSEEGQPTIQEVTIQKNTFLVTQYKNECDKIKHLPLKVKIEKDTSPKTSSSVNRSFAKMTTKSAIRKKRKRKSLVEMLAQHVDQETLKSVILAHAKQKCDVSSSPDSDSENDSDGCSEEADDVVSKIFQTVCTIDLCDDDDETLHEDVLQYMEDTEGIEDEATGGSKLTVKMQTSSTDHELPEQIKSLKASDEREKINSGTPETSVTITDTCVNDAKASKKSLANTPVREDVDDSNKDDSAKEPECTTKSTPVSVPDTTVADSCNATTSSLPITTSKTLSEKTESNNFNSLAEERVNVEVLHAPPMHDVSKVIETSAEETESNNLNSLAEERCNVEVLHDPAMHDTSKSIEMPDTSIGENVERTVDVAPPAQLVAPVDDKRRVLFSKNPENTDKELQNVATIDDVSNCGELDRIGETVDAGVDAAPATANISKLVETQDSNVTQEPKRAVLKLRPFKEICSSAQPNSFENDIVAAQLVHEPNKHSQLSFEETLTKADSVVCKQGKSKRTTKDIRATEKKMQKNPIDSNQNKRRNIYTSPPRKAQTLVDDKIKYSSETVNENSAGGPIKIKIKFGKAAEDLSRPDPIVNNELTNDVSKPTSSRKRKSQALEVPANTTTSIEKTRKRPMFDYFDSPEILTTKRARKSKSYADDDMRMEDSPPKTQPTNQRTSKRKSSISKSSVENVEVTKKLKDPETTEPVDDTAESTITADATITTEPSPQEILPLALTTPKSGRGVRPPVLAPIDIASQYICGNCKEEVVAKNWTKHIRSHYGLAWRVDVDPPIDMDNIHTMAAKVLTFTKKANIKILKCQKCNAEKKSALGFMSHVEVCGLTPEEIKSKLVKCEYCPSMIRSCSMKIHLTFCSGLKRLQKKEMESTKEVESSEECYNDAGRAVRRSAQKAMSSFKDLGKPPEAKIEDYVQRVRKVSSKQHRKWRQLLKGNISIECVRNGCDFTTDDLATMVHHFNDCVLIDGETFYCNRCDHGPDTRVAIEAHIKANHSLGVIESIDDKDFTDSDDEAEVGEESSESEGESGEDESTEKEGEECDYGDDDDDDGWNTKGYKKKRQRDWAHNEVMLNSCLDRKVLSEHSLLLKSYSGGSYFQPALEWTQDFRDKHYSNKDILPFATPNTFSVLNSTLTNLYIPRISISNKFLLKEVRKYRKLFGSTEVNETDSWKSLKRFEATKEDDSIVFFAGGPILSMAWLPVPDDHLSQMLAVCCRSDANEDILLNNTKPMKCLIQIWNFHKLKNGQLRHAQTPHLLYCIAYDHGPVIQMDFCPSGGFTEDRLGLLAVSSFDGHVDVLALPKNFTCDNSKIENLVFTIQPSFTLCCELDQPLGVLLTKFVWSHSKGHTKLAGGYSNGLVAIWNLKSLESPHICSKINGVPTLLPTDLFFAGNKTIRLLEFHHDEKNEARWLIAGSHDRKVKFFDTHNVYLEISTALAHSRIVAGCWPIHWTSFLLGIDNAYSLKTSGIVVKQPLDIGCRTASFYSCIGSTCDISFNNWLNTYVFVTSYGDIHCGYVRQLISGFGEARRQKSILGYTDSVNINPVDCDKGDDIVDDTMTASDEQPSTSSACTFESTSDVSYPSNEGIIFCDFHNPLPAVTSPSYEKIGAPPMSAYNMVKVNRVLFNPNVSAYKLYALGYDSGFVRINQLLPK